MPTEDRFFVRKQHYSGSGVSGKVWRVETHGTRSGDRVRSGVPAPTRANCGPRHRVRPSSRNNGSEPRLCAGASRFFLESLRVMCQSPSLFNCRKRATATVTFTIPLTPNVSTALCKPATNPPAAVPKVRIRTGMSARPYRCLRELKHREQSSAIAQSSTFLQKRMQTVKDCQHDSLTFDRFTKLHASFARMSRVND